MATYMTEYRRQLRVKDPEKYALYILDQRKRAQARRDVQKEKWLNEPHTREMVEAYEREKELTRIRNRRHYEKRKAIMSGIEPIPASPGKRPRDMTAEELRLHRNRARANSRAQRSDETLRLVREKEKEYRMRVKATKMVSAGMSPGYYPYTSASSSPLLPMSMSVESLAAWRLPNTDLTTAMLNNKKDFIAGTSSETLKLPSDFHGTMDTTDGTDSDRKDFIAITDIKVEPSITSESPSHSYGTEESVDWNHYNDRPPYVQQIGSEFRVEPSLRSTSPSSVSGSEDENRHNHVQQINSDTGPSVQNPQNMNAPQDSENEYFHASGSHSQIRSGPNQLQISDVTGRTHRNYSNIPVLYEQWGRKCSCNNSPRADGLWQEYLEEEIATKRKIREEIDENIKLVKLKQKYFMGMMTKNEMDV